MHSIGSKIGTGSFKTCKNSLICTRRITDQNITRINWRHCQIRLLRVIGIEKISLHTVIEVIVKSVLSTAVNMALGQPVNESSIYPTFPYYVAGPPELAVDGNFDTIYNHGSCSSTNSGPGGSNWFTVDLGQPYKLSHVAVTGSDGWSEFIVLGIAATIK